MFDFLELAESFKTMDRLDRDALRGFISWKVKKDRHMKF